MGVKTVVFLLLVLKNLSIYGVVQMYSNNHFLKNKNKAKKLRKKVVTRKKKKRFNVLILNLLPILMNFLTILEKIYVCLEMKNALKSDNFEKWESVLWQKK